MHLLRVRTAIVLQGQETALEAFIPESCEAGHWHTLLRRPGRSFRLAGTLVEKSVAVPGLLGCRHCSYVKNIFVLGACYGVIPGVVM